MKNTGFLNKLKKQEKLEIIEPSEEIKQVYIEKFRNRFCKKGKNR
ncbi:hypothetical protein BMS3Abin17_00552 [archaeon BMS3Abin17]|nr:hypothetical protein BMS3Abin17_00552 [archaeon BMS3Abin17]